MAQDWKATFVAWSKPSSDHEADKCDNTERRIREAIDASDWLKGKVSRVFAKGSYKNNTNVRLESDVDICVLANCRYWNSTGVPDYKPSSSCSYTLADFRNEVGKALTKKFGTSGVTRGDKAFDVHETSTLVDADVVPCMGYRHYFDTSLTKFEDGTKFYSDSNVEIINWPDQQVTHGNAKNTATGNRFKFTTRAVKRLRNKMADEGIEAADPIASYFIECLMFNVPNESFGNSDFYDDVRLAVAHAWAETQDDARCTNWLEVNKRKWLFRDTQPWTREQAHSFLLAAWKYVGFSA